MGQRTRVTVWPASISSADQLDGPLRGACVNSTLPPSSPATQNDTRRQVIASRRLYWPIPDRDQAAGPPAGSVEVSTSPTVETTTHNEVDAHETPVRDRAPSAATVHVDAPPAGLLDVTTSPASSSATHNDPDGHEIRSRW
jgi:hypothetical protein